MKKLTSILVLLIVGSGVGSTQTRSIITKSVEDISTFFVECNEEESIEVETEMKKFEENLSNGFYILNNIDTKYGEFISIQKFTKKMNFEIANQINSFIFLERDSITFRELKDLNKRFSKKNIEWVIKLQYIQLLNGEAKISKEQKEFCEKLISVQTDPKRIYSPEEFKWIRKDAEKFLKTRI